MRPGCWSPICSRLSGPPPGFTWSACRPSSSTFTQEPIYLPFLAMTRRPGGRLAVGAECVRQPGPEGHRRGSLEYKRVINATFAVFGLVAILSYLFQLELPRSYLLVMMPAGLLALLTSRFIWRRWLHMQRDSGAYMSQVLAVGNIHTVTELLRDLRRAPRAGYKVIGVCLSQDSRSVDADGGPLLAIDGVPMLGGLDRGRRNRPVLRRGHRCRHRDRIFRPECGPQAQLGARGHRRRADPGAGADQHRRPADPHPAGRRLAVDPRRPTHLPRREPHPEEVLRRHRQPAAGRCCSRRSCSASPSPSS